MAESAGARSGDEWFGALALFAAFIFIFYIFHFLWECGTLILKILAAPIIAANDPAAAAGTVLRQMRIVGFQILDAVLVLSTLSGLGFLTDRALKAGFVVNRCRLRPLRRNYPDIYAKLEVGFGAGAAGIIVFWIIFTSGFFLVLHYGFVHAPLNWPAAAFMIVALSLIAVYWSAAQRCAELASVRYEWFRNGMRPYYVLMPLLILAVLFICYTMGAVKARLALWVIGDHDPTESRATYELWIRAVSDVRWPWQYDLVPIFKAGFWAAAFCWILAEIGTPLLSRKYRKAIVIVVALASPFIAEAALQHSGVLREAMARATSAPLFIVGVIVGIVVNSVLDGLRRGIDLSHNCSDCNETLDVFDQYCANCGQHRPDIVASDFGLPKPECLPRPEISPAKDQFDQSSPVSPTT